MNIFCRSKTTLWILLICPYFVNCFIEENYSFSNPKDKDACHRQKFIKVSKYRRVSTSAMSRKSAEQCCKLRGMSLYSAERVDEPQKFSKLLQENSSKNGSGEWFWTSGNDLKTKGSFTWGFGKSVDDPDCRSYKWDNHTWEEPKVTKGHCIVIKPEGDKILMKIAKCKKDIFPFICEMEPQIQGRDLNVTDLMNCVGSNITDLKGYPSLKLFESVGTWHTASHCCRRRGWALVDQIAARGKKLFETVAKHPWGIGTRQNLFYWTSGNDFKEFRQWKWGCGDPAEDLDWLTGDSSNSTSEGNSTTESGNSTDAGNNSSSTSTGSPDNKMGDEHCLAYTGTDGGFKGEDYPCNEVGSIMCETNPRCNVSEQYPVGPKEPRTYDMLDDYFEEIGNCKSINFKPANPEDPNGLHPDIKNYDQEIFLGDQQMSWAAALKCCEDHEMTGMVINGIGAKQSLELIMLAGASKGEDKDSWDPTTSYWLAATNFREVKRSPMKWMDGGLVTGNVLDPIKIHDDIHPLCAKIGYVPPRGFFVQSANCLEKNTVICTKRNESFPAGANEEIPNAHDDAQLFVYNYTLIPPTAEEKGFKFVVKNRDQCPLGDHKTLYAEKCPNSTMIIPRIRSLALNVTAFNGSNKTIGEPEMFKIRSQNRKALLALVKESVFGGSGEDHVPSNGFKLLSISADIFSKMCPIVKPRFIQSVYKLFHRIHWLTSQGRTEILKTSDYKWIAKLLRNCSAVVKPLRARVDSCTEVYLATGNCSNYVCTSPKYEFKPNEIDPISDIMWKAFEMVHAVCFPHFEEGYRMHHQYSRAVLDLWSPDIRLRWFNQLGGHEYWVRVLGPHYATHFLNMERCTKASISKTFFHVRLPRKSVPKSRVFDEKEIIKVELF